jgi:hypothetical protein
MLTEILLAFITSNLVLAVLAAAAALGIVGSRLGVLPIGWTLLAGVGGKGALILLAFLFGFRMADERHETKALRIKLQTVQADLNAEKAARADDQKYLGEVARQKEEAEKVNDALKQYIDKLPTGDQCIATPDRLRELHKAR